MPKSPKPTIMVDIHEPAEVPQLLRGQGIAVTVIEALMGDYIWQCPLGVVMVERKTVNDLLASLGDGRLYRQLGRMVEVAALPILLVEGELAQYGGRVDAWRGKEAQKDWDFNGVANTLLSWQLAGIYVTTSPILNYTHIRLASLYKWSQKKKHLQPKRERKIPATGRLSQRAEVLAALPGVGVETAMKVAAEGTLKQLFSMSEQRWQKLLGPRRGAEVAKFLGGMP